MNLNDRIGAAREHLREVARAKAELDELQKRFAEAMQGLVDSIKNGDSTGNPITDYCIWRYRSTETTKHEESISELMEIVNSKQGELVLLSFRRTTSDDRGVGVEFPQESLRVQMAKISGGMVIRPLKVIAIPTGVVLSADFGEVIGSFPMRDEPEPGYLELSCIEPSLIVGSPIKIGSWDSASLEVELSIGNDAVIAWFRANAPLYPVRIWQMTRTLGVELKDTWLEAHLNSEKERVLKKIKDGDRHASTIRLALELGLGETVLKKEVKISDLLEK